MKTGRSLCSLRDLARCCHSVVHYKRLRLRGCFFYFFYEVGIKPSIWVTYDMLQLIWIETKPKSLLSSYGGILSSVFLKRRRPVSVCVSVETERQQHGARFALGRGAALSGALPSFCFLGLHVATHSNTNRACLCVSKDSVWQMMTTHRQVNYKLVITLYYDYYKWLYVKRKVHLDIRKKCAYFSVRVRVRDEGECVTALCCCCCWCCCRRGVGSRADWLLLTNTVSLGLF